MSSVIKRETYNLDYGREISLALVCNVKNTKDVRNKVIAGTIECCIMKPSLILDPFQIVVAANKAVVSEHANKCSSKTLYTEVLYNLSFSRSIAPSLAKFGVEETDTQFIVAVFNSDNNNIDKVLAEIDGEEKDMSYLKNFTDENLIKTTYKIKDDELIISSLLSSVVSRIASKDIW